MLFVLIGCILLVLKLFQVEHFANLSWWWIVVPLGFGVIWFEVIEPIFGLDIRRERAQYEQMSRRYLSPMRSNKRTPRGTSAPPTTARSTRDNNPFNPAAPPRAGPNPRPVKPPRAPPPPDD